MNQIRKLAVVIVALGSVSVAQADLIVVEEYIGVQESGFFDSNGNAVLGQYVSEDDPTFFFVFSHDELNDVTSARLGLTGTTNSNLALVSDRTFLPRPRSGGFRGEEVPFRWVFSVMFEIFDDDKGRPREAFSPILQIERDGQFPSGLSLFGGLLGGLGLPANDPRDFREFTLQNRGRGEPHRALDAGETGVLQFDVRPFPFLSGDFGRTNDFVITNVKLIATRVPEPGTLALFTLGLLGLALGRKRAG